MTFYSFDLLYLRFEKRQKTVGISKNIFRILMMLSYLCKSIQNENNDKNMDNSSVRASLFHLYYDTENSLKTQTYCLITSFFLRGKLH